MGNYVKESLALSFPCDILPENQVVMIFTVYLDESGTHQASRDVVLAGYVATNEQWASFETNWKKALAEFEIPFFHMSDFAAKKSYYSEWTEVERETRYERLIGIINANTTSSIGIIISRIDYAVAMGAIAPTQLSGIYGYIFQNLILIVRLVLLRQGYIDPQIAYVLDRRRHSGAIIALTDKMTAVLDALAREHGNELNPLAYLSAKTEDKRRFVPLQAADILAYQLYRGGANYHRQFKDKRISKHLNMLKTKDSYWERWAESEIRYSMSTSRDIRMNLLRGQA